MKSRLAWLTRQDWLIVGSGLALTSLISLGNMSRWSIWFDEAFSAMIIRHSFFDIARYTISDVHPPLYYWTLKLWSMIWGDDVVALRSLSLVWLLLAMIVVYVFVGSRFGRPAAALSTLLLTISPMLVRYSEEARMYTMVVFIVVSATYVLLDAVEYPTRRKWAAYGVLVGLGVLTHYMTLVMWAAHWVWRLWEVRKKTLRLTVAAVFSPDWRFAQYITVALIAPWLPFLVWQVINIQGGGFWIGPVSADTLPNYITNMYTYYNHNQVYSWLAFGVLIVLAVTALLVTRTYRILAAPQRKAYRLVTCLALVPPIVLFVGSLPPLRPSFVDRYTMAAIVFWTIWAGITYALSLRRRGWLRTLSLVALGTTVTLNIMGLSYVYTIGNYNKDNGSPHAVYPIMQMIARESAQRQPVVAQSSWVFYEVAYYETPLNPTFFRSEDTTKNGAYAMLRDDTERKITSIDDFSKSYKVAWFVVKDDGIHDMVAGFKGWQIVRVLQLPDKQSRLRAVEVRYVGTN